MTIDMVTSIINEGVQIVLLGSMPTVGTGLMVGVAIAVIQAVTQIQEQTLTFVPKLVVVLLVLAATFPWLASIVVEFALHLWTDIPMYAR